MRTALLFDGLGSQYPGMLAALGDHREIRETLTEAAGPLGRVTKVAVGALDSEQNLASAVGAQLAVLVAGVAAGRAALAESGPPAAVAGSGVGAFAAAVVTGVLRLDEAISIVHLRARMMARLFRAEDGMSMVRGLSPKRAQHLADAIGSVVGPLWLARVDGPEESVLAGSDRALRVLDERASEAGAHGVHRLDGIGPCHGPALRPVAAALADALVRLPERPATLPYAGSTNGAVLRSSSAVRADLALSVATTVRWHDAMSALLASGVEILAPVMPGTTFPAPEPA
jgi:malonate decarboxylase epsilon subunit